MIKTDAGDGLEGHGLAFTLGRGTEVIVAASLALRRLLYGVSLDTIFGDFGACWRKLCSEGQLRWVRRPPRVPCMRG